MKRRLPVLVAALALVTAACASSGEGTTTSSTAPAPTSPQPEAIPLSYTLAAGDELMYEVGLDEHIELTATGDSLTALGGEIPGAATVDLTGTAHLKQVVSPGPEDGTFSIHITGDFSDVSVTGTVDGEPIADDEAPDFAALEPVDVTVVVDEKGNVIPEDSPGLEDPFGGAMGDLGSLGSGGPAPGLDPGQFIGPPLPDDDVTVGDTWSDEIETPGMSEEPIVTTVTSTVTGTDEIDGAGVLVIDSTSTTGLIEFDLAEFFAGLFGAFLPDDASEEDAAQAQDLMDQMQFLITVDGTNSATKAWFDPEVGLVRKSEVTGATNIAMSISLPDDETGEMSGFEMNMKFEQNLTYRLLSGPAA
jgi:hypothetical protein